MKLALITNNRAASLGLLVAAGCAGCATQPAAETPFVTPGWEHHRFLNQPRPHPRLLVEIDAVEGSEPSADELASLEAFLREWTNKPGGVAIKVDNIIPRSLARHRSTHALALEFLNGPPDEDTAFLYILYYNSRLAGLGAKADNPQFIFFPYPCAVFMDRAYGFRFLPRTYAAVFWRAALLHEVGHALGLAHNEAHAKGIHCQNALCLMRSELMFRVRRFVSFRQPWENTTLCADCRTDLERYKHGEPQPGLRLWNGYFVHERPEFQVFTLPGFYYVHIGSREDFVPDALTEARRTALASMIHEETTLYGKTNTFVIGDHLPALALLAQEGSGAFADFVAGIFQSAATVLERLAETDPDEARALPWDELLAAATPYPAAHAGFTTTRQKLEASAKANTAPFLDR